MPQDSRVVKTFESPYKYHRCAKCNSDDIDVFQHFDEEHQRYFWVLKCGGCAAGYGEFSISYKKLMMMDKAEILQYIQRSCYYTLSDALLAKQLTYEANPVEEVTPVSRYDV